MSLCFITVSSVMPATQWGL